MLREQCQAAMVARGWRKTWRCGVRLEQMKYFGRKNLFRGLGVKLSFQPSLSAGYQRERLIA